MQPGKGAPGALVRDRVKDAEEGPIVASLVGPAGLELDHGRGSLGGL